MVINQLFNRMPTIDILNKIIKAFGLKDINDKKEFCELDSEIHNTVMVLRGMESEIKDYYIPCKQKKYFDNPEDLNYKSAITIFKQILKTHDYDLLSREKFIKGKKYQVYKIGTKQEKAFLKNKNSVTEPQEVVINWD